jgi:hypothetical protein
MKSVKSFSSVTKRLTILALAMVVMISCSEESLVEKPASVNEVPVMEIVEEADVASLTVSGIFTEVSTDVDCATCTYKVPDNVRTVDGTALGFKPGTVICVNSARKLGEIEFVNMIGTENAPIIIGTCDE